MNLRLERQDYKGQLTEEVSDDTTQQLDEKEKLAGLTPLT